MLYRSLERLGAEFRLRVVLHGRGDRAVLRGLDAAATRSSSRSRSSSSTTRSSLAVKSDRTQVEYCWTATPAVCLYALEHRPEPTRSPTSTPTSCSSPTRRRSSTSWRRRGADRAAPLRARASAQGADERDLQRRMADLPSRRGRAWQRCTGGTTAASSGATSASRTGRSATRSTSTSSRRASRRVHVLEHPGGGPRAVERHARTSSREQRRRVLGRRAAARLLPLPLAPPLPADRGRTARGGRLADSRAGVADCAALPGRRTIRSPIEERRLVWEPYLRDARTRRTRLTG